MGPGCKRSLCCAKGSKLSTYKHQGVNTSLHRDGKLEDRWNTGGQTVHGDGTLEDTVYPPLGGFATTQARDADHCTSKAQVRTRRRLCIWRQVRSVRGPRFERGGRNQMSNTCHSSLSHSTLIQDLYRPYYTAAAAVNWTEKISALSENVS